MVVFDAVGTLTQLYQTRAAMMETFTELSTAFHATVTSTGIDDACVASAVQSYAEAFAELMVLFAKEKRRIEHSIALTEAFLMSSYRNLG
jgi:hypothetical protein